jgi:hypothetical protein
MRTWVQRIRATLLIAPGLGLTLAVGTAAGQADQTAELKDVLAQVRAAQGGDKLATIKTLSAEGSSRVTFGDREISNDLQFKFILPDKFQRIMQPELPNGMPGPRLAMTVNGADAWNGSLDPMPNFGGGGGGGEGRRGGGGGGGPMAVFNGQNPARVRGDLLRTVVGIFPGSDQIQGVTYSYVGTAQSKDGGEADVIAVKAQDVDAKLFIDKKTHLPLMVTYQGPDMSQMRQFMRGPGGPGGAGQGQAQGQGGQAAPGGQGGQGQGPPPMTDEERQKRAEEMRKRFESLPQVEYQLYFADYKKVDGIMLPTRITRSVNGAPAEEVTINKYKINPKIDPNDFQKKGS